MLRTDLLPWLTSIGPLGDDVLEIGPGPGLTTDLLRERTIRLTAVEVDPVLARALADRLSATNVEVVEGDAVDVVLEDGRFSAATCFSVLHHMPSPAHQDRVFARIGRLLMPGGLFAAVDSRDLEPIRENHIDDTFVPVPPSSLEGRLERAGLRLAQLDEDDYQIRFVARKPD